MRSMACSFAELQALIFLWALLALIDLNTCSCDAASFWGSNNGKGDLTTTTTANRRQGRTERQSTTTTTRGQEGRGGAFEESVIPPNKKVGGTRTPPASSTHHHHGSTPHPHPHHHHHHHHHHPRPERGKVLTTLTAQDMYRAYREIQQDYQTKAFAPTTQWKLLKERDGVQVSMLQHPDDPTCPYVKMTGTIPASVQDCWNFLLVAHWDETMPKMDPFYEGVSIVGECQHNAVEMILCRKRTKRILTFGKRDLVFLSVVDEPLPDGTWVSGSVSVVTPQVPRQHGYTRAFQDSIAFYQPIDNNTRTNLTIVCRIDLNDSGEQGAGGWIPMWLYVKTIGITAVESVLRMRRAIMAETTRNNNQMQGGHNT